MAGKCAIITGAARGLGLAIAERFAREGADVVIADVLDDVAVESAARIMAETGRLGEPCDIAAAAVFLASDEAAPVTGATLRVDGGREPIG